MESLILILVLMAVQPSTSISFQVEPHRMIFSGLMSKCTIPLACRTAQAKTKFFAIWGRRIGGVFFCLGEDRGGGAQELLSGWEGRINSGRGQMKFGI